MKNGKWVKDDKTEKKKVTWKKRKVGDGSKSKSKLPKPTQNANSSKSRRVTYVKVDGKWVKMNADGTLADETAKETAKPTKTTTTTAAARTTTRSPITKRPLTTERPPATRRPPTTKSTTTRRRKTTPSITKENARKQAIFRSKNRLKILRLKQEVEKEMNDFEEYSQRVARFMKTL